MASKPIVARLSDGREYGFESPSVAYTQDPEAVIIRHQDGTSFEAGELPVANAIVNEYSRSLPRDEAIVGTADDETLAKFAPKPVKKDEKA